MFTRKQNEWVIEHLQTNRIEDYYNLVLYCYSAIKGYDIFILEREDEVKYIWHRILQFKTGKKRDHVLFLKERDGLVVIIKEKCPKHGNYYTCNTLNKDWKPRIKKWYPLLQVL